MSANVVVERSSTGLRGANVTVEGSRTKLSGATIAIEQPGRGLSGFRTGLGDAESEMAAMVSAASTVKTRKVIAGASGVGGAALLLTGIFNKGAARWPPLVVGALATGFGAWLASNIQSEKVFPWETPAS